MSSAPAPLLSAKELAPLIGLTAANGEKTVRRWHNDGKIPAAIAEATVVRFDLADVRAALAKRAAKKKPGPVILQPKGR